MGVHTCNELAVGRFQSNIQRARDIAGWVIEHPNPRILLGKPQQKITSSIIGAPVDKQELDGSFDLLARDDSSQKVDASSLVPGRRENAQDDSCVRSGHRPNPGSDIFKRHLSSQQ